MRHTFISPRRLVFAGAVGLVALLAACSPGPDAPEPETPPSAVATFVNGEPIYASDVELEAVAQGVISPGDAFTKDHSDYTLVLDQVIDQRLMAEEARRLGLDQDAVAARRLAAAEERILANLLIESLVAREITDERIDEMYAEQAALQQVDDEVEIAHILVETEDKARELYQEILDGAEFESLVFNNSIDETSRLDNGNLGYVAPNEQPEPFGAVIADTKVGEVSEPFKSAGGWHILKVKDRRTLAPKTKEEMRPEIVTFLTLTEISTILRRLRAEAAIEQGETGARDDIGLNPMPGTTPRPVPDTNDTPDDTL